MKRIVISSPKANKIYLLLFLVIAGGIFFIMAQELFFPTPPLPIIDVAKERVKINQAGLQMTPARFYRVIGGETVK